MVEWTPTQATWRISMAPSPYNKPYPLLRNKKQKNKKGFSVRKWKIQIWTNRKEREHANKHIPREREYAQVTLGIVFGSSWNHLGILLGLSWDPLGSYDFEDMLASVCNMLGSVFILFWHQVGITSSFEIA